MSSGRAPRLRHKRSRTLAGSVVELAHVLVSWTPAVLGVALLWFVIALVLTGSAGQAGRGALTVVIVGLLIAPLESMAEDGFSWRGPVRARACAPGRLYTLT